MRPALLALLLCSCLQGCGLKGPLYLPTVEEEREMAERERALREREQREREQARQPASAAPTPPVPARADPLPAQ